MTSTATEPATSGAEVSGAARHFVMCPPTFFGVRYSINPCMRPDDPVDADRAGRQWRRLREQLVVQLATDELRKKAGGGAKCCVLERHPAPRPD